MIFHFGSPLKTRLKADLLLFGVALIWGAAFIAQGIAAAARLAFLFNGASFLLAALVLLPFMPRTPGRRSAFAASLPLRRPKGMALWIVAAGTILFAATALQQVGLLNARIADAGFLTSLYAVITPFLLWLGFRERPKVLDLVAVLLAVCGAWFLASPGSSAAGARVALDPRSLILGDGLEIIGAFFWALHFVVLGKFAIRFEPLRFACGQFLVTGILNLVVGLFVEPVASLAAPALVGAIVFRATLSIGLGYTLQVWGQRHTPPTDAALILGLEAVFAALAAWLILGQGLAIWQLAGCALIFASVLLAQAKQFEKRKPA